MKRSFMILSLLVAALAVPVPAWSAPAQITFVSITGNWHDPTDNVPGSQPGQPVITNGVPTSSINWGVTSGPQSGYDFSRTIPGPQTLPPAPTPFFPLGTFTHRNFPISDPSLTSVQLDVVLVLNVDGVQTPPLNFTFTFHHEETPNNLNPCPYPTPPGEGCTDRVTFVSAPALDVQRWWSGLHIVHEFCQQRYSGGRIYYKRRPYKHREPGRTIYVATDDDSAAGAQGDKVGSGGDESGTVG